MKELEELNRQLDSEISKKNEAKKNDDKNKEEAENNAAMGAIFGVIMWGFLGFGVSCLIGFASEIFSLGLEESDFKYIIFIIPIIISAIFGGYIYYSTGYDDIRREKK